MMKNGTLNVEYNANAACSGTFSLVWNLLWILWCVIWGATSMVDSWCCIFNVSVLFAAAAVHLLLYL
jgi:hypothetical protein